MRVATDDQRHAGWFEDRKKMILRRQPGKDLGVAPRRSVAEHYLADAGNFEAKRQRPLAEDSGLLGQKLMGYPAYDVVELLWDSGAWLGTGAHGQDFAFAVAANEVDGHLKA